MPTLPGHTDNICRPSANPELEALREEIAAQTAEYLARGGKIKQIPHWLSVIPARKLNKDEFKDALRRSML